MDLSRYDPRDAVERARSMQLRSPFDNAPLFDEEDRPIVFWVLSVRSRAGRAAVSDHIRSDAGTSEEKSAEALSRFAAAVTTSWTGHLELEGQDMPFSPENAFRLYQSQEWVRSQVIEFSQSLRNYGPEV